jgi:NodT family efflux transporter outer membrane factor (OMF) lipoprotein
MVSSADDLAAERLSLEGQLADTYVQLRGLDGQIKLLDDTIGVYDKALALTNDRHAKGIASGLDVARAETQLEDAKSDLSDTAARRALLEHAIASLVGKPASEFSVPGPAQDMKIPNVPVAIPSTVLQQRPDVAAAERRVAAANAEIGVARAAFFPTISLGALTGFQNTGGAGLLSAPNSYWTLGPNAAMALFDGGKRQSEVRAAKADYRETAAAYRTDVLQAFQDVEDSLALLNYLADEAASKTKSVQSATRTASMAMALYRLGATSYLDVVTAQTEAQQDQLAALSLQTRRLQASVQLIQAIGGGWSARGALSSGTVTDSAKPFATGPIAPKNGLMP